jgi:hypothetical protein
VVAALAAVALARDEGQNAGALLASLRGTARARDGLRAAGVRGGGAGDRKAGEGEARRGALTLHELRAREGAEGTLDLESVSTDAIEEVLESRGGATARESKQGAEDGDLGAHGCHYVQH